MPKIDLMEIKILISSIATTFVFNMDIFLSFITPILSAFTWWVMRPYLDMILKKIKDRKNKKE